MESVLRVEARVEPVRIGIIGVGNMGKSHANDCVESELVELVALCDTDASILDSHPGIAHRVTRYEELLSVPGLEAVLIATPHFDHTPIALAAFERGISVLCEKPIGSTVGDVTRMIDAYEHARVTYPDIKFGAMFQQRTLPHWQRIREMLQSGALGTLVRATWIITDWFRTQYYYDMGHWRATWSGEGGGVLLNQCIHNLDLYQWFFGMPTEIVAQVSLGKYHEIEVEDEIAALFGHGDGMIGQFVSSTAESPGTNRLEIVGEDGKLVYENGTLTYDRNSVSMLEAIRRERKAFMHVEHRSEEIELSGEGGTHREVIEGFARSIRDGSLLVADGAEGLGSVALANGILMSHFTGGSVKLPLNAEEYEALLGDLKAGRASRARSVSRSPDPGDPSTPRPGRFHRRRRPTQDRSSS